MTIEANFYKTLWRPARNVLMRNWPSGYLSMCRLRRPLGVISDRTEIVIEAYPRSGNSFAEAALVITQGREVDIAHHTHSTAQVWAASKKKIPCIVLFRNPFDSCRSLCIHDPTRFSPACCAREWLSFYSTAQQFRSDFLLVSFEALTGNFLSVLEMANERFGLELKIPTDFSPVAALREVDARSRNRGTVKEVEPYSPDASQEQKSLRAELAVSIDRKFVELRSKQLGRDLVEAYSRLQETADI